MPSQTSPLDPGRLSTVVSHCLCTCGVSQWETLGAWAGRAGVWTRKLKFICLWNSEARICGSVTIPHTSPSIFQGEHLRFWFYTFRARCVYNNSPSSDTRFLLYSDSQKWLNLMEIWFLVSTCCVALASCLTILHCSAYCTRRWWRTQDKVTAKVPRACPCCPCLAEQ